MTERFFALFVQLRKYFCLNCPVFPETFTSQTFFREKKKNFERTTSWSLSRKHVINKWIARVIQPCEVRQSLFRWVMYYLRKLANDAVLAHGRQDTHDENPVRETQGYESHLTMREQETHLRSSKLNSHFCPVWAFTPCINIMSLFTAI